MFHFTDDLVAKHGAKQNETRLLRTKYERYNVINFGKSSKIVSYLFRDCTEDRTNVR